MGKIDTFKKLWNQDRHQVLVAIYNNIVHTGITNLLPDKAYLKLTYRVRFGERLDFADPATFSQKIQWLKLYDRQERYIDLVDKVKVKEIVAKEIGQQYIIPTLGVWKRFEDIDFDLLPNQFVLKCNHDSGSIVICRDKSKFDIKKAKRKIEKGMRSDMFYWGREWPYKEVERKILAEAYLEETEPEELTGFKQKIYSSENCALTGTKRSGKNGLKIAFYKTDCKTAPFEYCYPINKKEIKFPLDHDEIAELAEKLAEDIPIAGIDFYEVDESIYYGEVILNSDSDNVKFTPSEWDKTLGNCIKLPGDGVLLVRENVVLHFHVQQSNDLTDYKMFCFDGKPMYCQIITGRTSDERIDFYDMDWKLQPFVGLTPLVVNSGFNFAKPRNFEKMKEFAAKLSGGTSFSRIDFYEVNGKLYFGEFTLYPASGFGTFSPAEWNRKLGDLIPLK